MKIKLFCNGGMSTSMLVNKMKKAAEAKDFDVEIEAFPGSMIEKQSDDCDVVLLGPQIKYLLASTKLICEPKGVPVAAIDMRDYGMMNGEKVLDIALKMYEQDKK